MSAINEKINVAKTWAKKIKLSQEFERVLFELKDCIMEADTERKRTGMTAICTKCGQDSESCCGSGIELKYSPQLLLINILFGVKMPSKSEFPDKCYFLKSNGCCLFARDVFCINFICYKIKDKLSPRLLRKLRELEGKQLHLQFILEEKLKKLMVE